MTISGNDRAQGQAHEHPDCGAKAAEAEAGTSDNISYYYY